MIISDEQARLAAQYIRTIDPERSMLVVGDVSPELMQRVRAAVDGVPDLREDRVEEARAHLKRGDFTSSEVAGKMVARIVSDAIR